MRECGNIGIEEKRRRRKEKRLKATFLSPSSFL
jgi:hypothetical protein